MASFLEPRLFSRHPDYKNHSTTKQSSRPSPERIFNQPQTWGKLPSTSDAMRKPSMAARLRPAPAESSLCAYRRHSLENLN